MGFEFQRLQKDYVLHGYMHHAEQVLQQSAAQHAYRIEKAPGAMLARRVLKRRGGRGVACDDGLLYMARVMAPLFGRTGR